MNSFHILLFICACFCRSAFSEEEIDFPPLLDSDDIAYFFQRGDLDGLHWALANVFLRSERNPSRNDEEKVPLTQTLISRGGGSTYTTAYKLNADLEQAQYLVRRLKEVDKKKANFFQDVVIPVYESVLKNIPPLDQLEHTHGLYAFQRADVDAGILEIYNKALHHTAVDEFEQDGSTIPLLNPKLDVDKIERQWFGQDETHKSPGVVVVDNILSSQALDRIRQVLLESTVWYQTKMPKKFGGYVGAYIDDGLYDRILLKLAFELHRALPNIMKDHPLKYLWAYKYDSEYSGINTHADQAAVNVNLWITPNEANLDPSSGGLVIFTSKPPDHWDFEQYNTDTEKVVKELLRPSNFANVTVPHLQNRAVIFDSALFHHTDTFKFRKGYENRRINLTLLYGNMQRGKSTSGKEGVASSQKQEL